MLRVRRARRVEIHKGRQRRMRLRKLTWAITAILALQSILGAFQLLDAFQVTCYPMVHRATMYRVFSLGFSLTPVLIFFVLINLGYLLNRKTYAEILVSAYVSIVLYFFKGLDVSVAFTSLMLGGVAVLDSRRFQDYFTWLLALLTVFEGAALIHWILLPLGVVSPLAWFADLELSLFYVAARLAPLLVLPLMFMWILKPLLRWGLGKVRDYVKVI